MYILKQYFFYNLKSIFLLVFLCWQAPLFAQKIARSDAKRDAKALKTILFKDHPAPFAYITRDSVVTELSNLLQFEGDSIALSDWENRIRALLVKIGCGHTYVASNRLVKGTKDPKIFPFQIFSNGGKIWVRKGLDSLQAYKIPEGAEILTMNKIHALQLVERLSKHQPSDGYNQTFGERTLNKGLYFSYLYRRYFSKDSIIEVRWRKGSEPAQTALVQTVLSTKLREAPLVPDTAIHILYTANKGKVEFYYHPQHTEIAVLRIKSFDGNSIRSTRVYKKAFRMMRKKGTQHLVIDVRDNLGGSFGSCVDLTKYVADSSFQVLLSRPLFRTWRYQKPMNHLGRVMFLLLYDGINFSPRWIKKGRAYYKNRYKPHKKNHFEGQTYVLTNGWSFSASSLTAAYMQAKSKRVTVIGTETGGGGKSNNGMQIPVFILPASKIKIKVPQIDLDLRLGLDQGRGVMPDVPVRYTIEDILAKRDLEWEAVLSKYSAFPQPTLIKTKN